MNIFLLDGFVANVTYRYRIRPANSKAGNIKAAVVAGGGSKSSTGRFVNDDDVGANQSIT